MKMTPRECCLQKEKVGEERELQRPGLPGPLGWGVCSAVGVLRGKVLKTEL